MQIARNCPVCCSIELSVHLDAAEPDLTSAVIGSSRHDVALGRVLRCRACGFAFRQQRPSERELASLYREMDVKTYEAEAKGRKRTAEIGINIVERRATGGRLLDVGCASGAFLLAARDRGWEVVGVEPSPTLADRARTSLLDGSCIIQGTLQDADLPTASFDVVTLWDVLEHVQEPRAFLSTCAALLRVGGYLFANVPDLDSWPARLLRDRWPLLLPEHLNYFNPPSLRRCGNYAGLTLVDTGRRWARFSAGYVLYRLEQHRIPGARILRRTLDQSQFSALIVPIPLGEVYAVWTRP